MTNDVVADDPLDPLRPPCTVLAGTKKNTDRLGAFSIYACNERLLVSFEVSMPCSWEPNPKS